MKIELDEKKAKDLHFVLKHDLVGGLLPSDCSKSIQKILEELELELNKWVVEVIVMVKEIKNKFCALCTAGGKMCIYMKCDCGCHEEWDLIDHIQK